MSEWVYASLIVFLASSLQSITGFGFAIIATPFLLMVFDSRDCIKISIILSFFISIVLTPRLKKEIDYHILKRLILGSVLGVPIGVLFFTYVSLEILKLIVGLVVLFITMFLLYKWYQVNVKMNSLEALKDRGKHWELLVGFSSGIMTTSIGMPGVPLALYFSALNTNKEIIRSTTLAFFIVVYLTSMFTQLLTVGIEKEVLLSSLILIPSVAVGIFVGSLLFVLMNTTRH